MTDEWLAHMQVRLEHDEQRSVPELLEIVVRETSFDWMRVCDGAPRDVRSLVRRLNPEHARLRWRAKVTT